MIHFGAMWETKIAAAGRGSPSVTAWAVKKPTFSCLVLLHHGCISFGLLLDVFWNDFSIILGSKIEAEMKQESCHEIARSRIEFHPKVKEALL